MGRPSTETARGSWRITVVVWSGALAVTAILFATCSSGGATAGSTTSSSGIEDAALAAFSLDVSDPRPH